MQAPGSPGGSLGEYSGWWRACEVLHLWLPGVVMKSPTLRTVRSPFQRGHAPSFSGAQTRAVPEAYPGVSRGLGGHVQMPSPEQGPGSTSPAGDNCGWSSLSTWREEVPSLAASSGARGLLRAVPLQELLHPPWPLWKDPKCSQAVPTPEGAGAWGG